MLFHHLSRPKYARVRFAPMSVRSESSRSFSFRVLQRLRPQARVRMAVMVSAFLLLTSIAATAATLTVTKTADTNDNVCNSDCSLREAIAMANASPSADTIVFDPAIFSTPQTITLVSGTLVPLNAGGGLSLVGPGAELLTISGNDTTVILTNEGETLTVSDVTVTNGRGGQGGAIFSGFQGDLTLDRVVVKNSINAIYNNGADGSSITIRSCKVQGNAGNFGATAVFSSGPIVIEGSEISGNGLPNQSYAV